ncbi:MAG TPA: STAS domain-containing protein [Steroidobacteraceae bacterium]|nr:STAS domain-containing protein [Steroidobacteraceae bacterium]
MKTRKQKIPASKRARRPATKRSAQRAKAAAGKAPRRRVKVRDDGSLTLAAECTVAEAESLKSELARRLDEAGPVTLDVSALQRIDTAGLQLLAAFVRDRRTAGRVVQWRGSADALAGAAGLLGLTDMLELPREVGR